MIKNRPTRVTIVPITSLLVTFSRISKNASKRTNIGSVAPNTDANETDIYLIAAIESKNPP